MLTLAGNIFQTGYSLMIIDQKSTPLRSVQVLRGFAAIAVLLYHAGIYASIHFKTTVFNFEYGTLGVDFFFTLSGFIITYVHLKDIQEKGSVWSFAVKRFLRIFPFYWLVLLMVIALDPATFPGWKLFLENVLLFRLPMSQMPLKVAWSLTSELMFYFLFAIAIAAGWKTARIMLVSWLLIIVLAPVMNNGFYQVLVGNMNIEFMFGCLAGYVFLQKNYSSNVPLFITGIIILAILFTVCIIWTGFDRFSIIYTTLMGATSGWIIYHAALLDTTKWSRMLALPLLVLAGDASYSIYLTHTVYMPYLFKGTTGLLNFSAVNHLVQLLVILFIIAISIAAGIVIHLWIEKPMLIYLRRKFHLARSGTSLS